MGNLKSVEELFEGRHFDREVIILCVRWGSVAKLTTENDRVPAAAVQVAGWNSSAMKVA